MTAYNSTQYAATANAPLKPNEMGGRVRMAMWEYTTPSGGLNVGDTINLVKLPVGARILDGYFMSEAMSSSTGTATVSIGVASDATKYLGATSVDAAAQGHFANTVALNGLEELSAETTLIATVGGEAWAASKAFKGYVLYVVD